MKNKDPGLQGMLDEIVQGAENADLEQRRKEHFMHIIASLSDLSSLYNLLKGVSTSHFVATQENKVFFEDAVRQVGRIIDQLSMKNNPLLPTTVAGMLKYVESGDMQVSMTYGLRQKV